MKAKKNVNESVDEGDDRYILHLGIYTRYKHIYVNMYKYIPDIVKRFYFFNILIFFQLKISVYLVIKS